MSERTCSVDDCDRIHLSRGWCRLHYKRWYKTQPQWQRTKYSITCVMCGVEHLAARRESKYCSDACKGEHYAANGIGKQRTRSPLPETHPVMVLIGEAQREADDQRARAKAERAARRDWRTPRSCRACGAAFCPLYSPSQTTCSSRCSRSIGRRDRRVRRTDSKSINWQVVLRRDGAACYLCGYDTNPSDYTYRTGRDGREAFIIGLEYPSVDHVIPLAAGGRHELDNVRLAHTYCNSIKSDHPLEMVA